MLNIDLTNSLMTLLALVLSVIAILQTYKRDRKDEENQKVINRMQADRLLDNALDLMNGNIKGSETIVIHDRAPTQEERRFFELANRNIEEALNLCPKYYISHQYMGLYFRCIKNDMAALTYHREAVKLAEKGDDLDGWPYHDLATTLEAIGESERLQNGLNSEEAWEKYFKEAESLYKKAISKDSNDPFLYEGMASFYENMAGFYPNNSDTFFEKFNELICEARKIANKVGKVLLIDRD